MKLINLTPHTLNVVTGADTTVTIEPSGSVARVSVQYVVKGNCNGIPLYSSVYGDLQGLPEAEEGTMYIVSTLVASAAKELGRDDILSPGELVRDENGQPVGCRGLVKW